MLKCFLKHKKDTAVGAECTFDKRLCPAPTGGDDSYNTGFTNGKKNFPISWKGSKGVWRYSMRSQVQFHLQLLFKS